MLLLHRKAETLAAQDLDRPPLGPNCDGRPRSRTAAPADPAGAALRRDLAGRDSTSLRPVFHVTAGGSVIEPTGQQAITESDRRPTAFLVNDALPAE
jgi:hypothetical protein